MDLGADKSMPNKWWANLDTYIPNKGELYSAVQFLAYSTLLAIYTDYLYFLSCSMWLEMLATYILMTERQRELEFTSSFTSTGSPTPDNMVPIDVSWTCCSRCRQDPKKVGTSLGSFTTGDLNLNPAKSISEGFTKE